MIYSHSGHSRSTSLIPPKSRVFTNHKFGNAIDITKCRFAPFRYIGPRVKPAAMHLWLSATSHISRFSKSLRQVQALGLMDFVNPRPVIRNPMKGEFFV